MKKRILGLFISLCLTVSMFPVSASAFADSGYCGPGVTWDFDRSTGTLSISGTSVMNDYNRTFLYHLGGGLASQPAPWYDFADQIKNIIISPGIKCIGDYAFRGCRIKTISIPDSVSRIGAYAFYECKDLENIDIPFGVDVLYSGTFDDCVSLSNITIPSTVVRICSAFSNCTSLSSISIPNNVTEIKSWAFHGCSGLRSVQIPDHVSTIESETFGGCSSLTEVHIPESVRSIEREAFSGCTRLSDVYYSGHKAQWGDIEINEPNDELKASTVHFAKGTEPSLYTPFQKVATYTPGQFLDVPATSWYAGSVQTAYEYGMMNGVSNTSFAPNGNLTTASAIALACRLHNLYYKNGATFPSESPWYQPYVRYAQENKIIAKVEGYPYQIPITRADFATLISNALPDAVLQKINTFEYGAIPDVSAGSPFMDAVKALADANVLTYRDSITIYFMSLAYGKSLGMDDVYSISDSYKAIYRLYFAGILVGNDEHGTFTPDAYITRSAVAAIIARVMDPTLRRHITLVKQPTSAKIVPMNQLKNLVSLRKGASNAQLAQSYEAARKIVEPLANLSREAQLCGISIVLRIITDSKITYSMSASHYDDPYGFFILNKASCAGCTRATGLCLNMLGIPYEHINENKYSHQWTRVNIDGQYWICDAYGMYCGPERVPYQHPAFP